MLFKPKNETYRQFIARADKNNVSLTTQTQIDQDVDGTYCKECRQAIVIDSVGVEQICPICLETC